jgi:hypothetical protein
LPTPTARNSSKRLADSWVIEVQALVHRQKVKGVMDEDISDRMDRVKNGLRNLLHVVSRKRGKTIKEALGLLDYFEMLQWEVDELCPCGQQHTPRGDVGTVFQPQRAL